MLYKNLVNDNMNKSGFTKLQGEELIKLQEAMIVCYKEINMACRKHGIKLILQGGSLLGSVRHGGFIPWDDDMDFAMVRSDYEKFKKSFEDELSDKYILSVPNNGGKSYERFMQLYRKDTVMEDALESAGPNYIKIDVFPLDYAPDNAVIREIKGIFCNALMFIAECVNDRENAMILSQNDNEGIKNIVNFSLKGRAVYGIRAITGKIFSFKSGNRWYDLCDKMIRSRRKTAYLTSATGSRHYLGEVLKTDAFLPVTIEKFQGIKMYAPNKTKTYLRNLYGDYMKIPPEEKRQSHYIKAIDVDRILDYERTDTQ